MRRSSSSQRLRILASNYGRELGWFVYRRGTHVANLRDPQFVDMFIESYRVEHLDVADPSLEARNEAFWTEKPLTFVSAEFGEPVTHAVPLRYRGGEEPRLEIRGLYLDVPPPDFWESLRLWQLRRRKRAAANRR